MSDFKIALEEKIRFSLHNKYGIENYDELRFGKYVHPGRPTKKLPNQLLVLLKQIVKRLIGYKNSGVIVENIDGWLSKEHQNGLQQLYGNLNSQGMNLLVELMAYRKLGYRFVKLKRNDEEYRNAINVGDSLADTKDTYDPHFMHFILEKVDLNPIGMDVKLYFTGGGVAIDFIIEQYAYKSNGKAIVEAEKGDVVIDAGACWGDTALYFAHKVGSSGKVYSFEFIPGNIKLFNINISFNPELKKRIELIEHPVSNKTGEKIYFFDNGPGSRVEIEPFERQTGSTTTITIDDLVKTKNIDKVDFIKMDIEGAESFALEGALETIKRYRPKLAIAIYHSMSDFVNIPNWILNLNLDYDVFIDHYTIHAEETVCFAKPRKRE